MLHWRKGSGIDAKPPRFGEINAGQITTFSDVSIVAENRVTPVQDIPSDIRALLGCAITTGFGIVVNDLKLTPGQSILVYGAGGLGLSVIMAAKAVSAYPIHVVEISDSKFAFSKQFGAGLHTLAEYDAVVDTTGDALVRKQAYQRTKIGGTCVLAGVPQAHDTLTIDSFPLHMGRRLIGSHGGDANPDIDIPRYAKLWQAGICRFEQLITNRYKLEQINDAITAVRLHEVWGRAMIEMD